MNAEFADGWRYFWAALHNASWPFVAGFGLAVLVFDIIGSVLAALMLRAF